MSNVEEVFYTSVWNGGFEVITSAKYNKNTGQVFDIEGSDIEVDDDGDELEFLEGEFITLLNGTKLDVEEVGGDYFVVSE